MHGIPDLPPTPGVLTAVPQAAAPVFGRYGPFWVATTLIFTSTVSGNYANYLSYKRDEAAAAGAAGAPSPSGAAAPAGDQKVWYYDINKVRRRPEKPAAMLCWPPRRYP